MFKQPHFQPIPILPARGVVSKNIIVDTCVTLVGWFTDISASFMCSAVDKYTSILMDADYME